MLLPLVSTLICTYNYYAKFNYNISVRWNAMPRVPDQRFFLKVINSKTSCFLLNLVKKSSFVTSAKELYCVTLHCIALVCYLLVSDVRSSVLPYCNALYCYMSLQGKGTLSEDLTRNLRQNPAGGKTERG